MSKIRTPTSQAMTSRISNKEAGGEREKRSRDKKVITVEEDTPLRSTPRIKKPRTLPPYLSSSSNEEGDDNNDKKENSEDDSEEELGFKDENYHDDGYASVEDNNEKSGSQVREIQLPQVPRTPLFIEVAPMPIVEWWGYPGIQALYEQHRAINPKNRKPFSGLYLERILTTIGMCEMTIFDARFKPYKFE